MIRLSAKQQLTCKRSLLYIITTILVVSFILLTLHTNPATLPNKKISSHIDSFMKQVKVKSFSHSGAIEDTITGSQVMHNAKTGNILLDSPHIIAAEENAASWHIQAVHGQVTSNKNKNVYLWGHVKINQPLNITQNNITLLTSSVHYNSRQKIAVTDKPVTIIQPDSVIYGEGMVADIQHGDIKILHHTHAQYVMNEKAKKE